MWQYKQFEELSAHDYHQIVKERTKVFVVEQGCAYQEIDDIDLHAVHLIKRQKGTIKAYARIYKQDKKNAYRTRTRSSGIQKRRTRT